MKDMSMKKVLLYTFGGFMSITLILIILSWFVVIENKEMRGQKNPSFTCLNTTNHQNVYKEIKVTDIFESSFLMDTTNSCGYNSPVFSWTNDGEHEIAFNINMEQAGNYYIGLDYLSLNESIIDNSISVYINGTLQSSDAANMRLLTSWTNDEAPVSFDTYNNQILNRQIPVKKWDYTVLRSNLLLSNEYVNFNLNEGLNTIKIVKDEGEFLLGNIYIINPITPPTYTQYLNQVNATPTSGELIAIEAENSAYKNDISIRYENEKSPSVSPYSSKKNYINIVGDYFNVPGQKITYAFNVEEAGYYNLTLKYKQDIFQNINSYRNIYVNDKIVFNELNSYEFHYSSHWKNETLGTNDKFQFYFDKGLNTISIEVDASYVDHHYKQVMQIIEEISELSLEIKKLTGGVEDAQREWNLDKYLPHAKLKLDEWHNEVNQMLSDIKVLRSNPKQSNEIEKKLESVLDKLTELKNNHNQLPGKMNLLSEGSSSVAQSLALISESLITMPLSLDTIYIHSTDVNLPKPNAGLFKNILASMQRVIAVASSVEDEDEVLEVWVNRSRFYVELMQQMADQQFTPKTGVKVKFSVMPDEQKLIMANAANTQPDVALGVSGWLPYELGLRGAAASLNEFDGFYEIINNYEPGSLLHMVYNDKLYGFPETQDFFVTFYRKDIMDSLNLEVPQTYSEIVEILPTLQRYGMNYYLPLSGTSGLKALSSTAPFIYQYGGDLYNEQSFTNALNSKNPFSTDIDTPQSLEAINTMIELYTLYSLPLQTSNFYDSFRSGVLPIGVSTFDTYTKLLFAAPEIANKWEIAPTPGVRQADGTIRRDTMGTAQSVVLFEKSDKKQEGFDFLEWWLSTEVQQQFTYDLQLIYGQGFLWNSANIKAFRSLPIERDHIAVIEEQWQSIHEVPKIPGGYVVERNISNVWNKVVFDSESVRVTVDDAVILINREIKRKMQEFGYIDNNGNVVKNYILPTKERIIEWQNQAKK